MTKKTKLLVQGDYPLIASPTLAQAYGVASAIFLQKLHYCLQSQEAQVIQQQKYFYHSYEQWAETLGTYSPSTIKRIVSKLKKVGILVVKKLSQNKWIQTNFYSINYRKLSALLKGSTESVEIESSEKKPVHSLTPSPKLVKNSAQDLKVSALTQPKTQTKPNKIEGLLSPLAPMASSATLDAMSLEKRGLYNQLIQLKIDIHYDDARLDEWLKRKKFILQKAAYLKDQLGHLKMRWYSPEQLGLN
ncbi:hypothetical protein [Acinetobacter lanii]|uniref:Replication protein n=1 Tax=Acinetobacter lanii TaxID=2715163 RepID=A0A6G8S3C8_9GAMM|nr:hypothetical protein [Acinetobacter lanii]QIO08657.1 hypothetical protein G8D99_06220 [Acinetobacter lanii]